MTIARRAATPGGTPAATWLLLAYALFVVYGSLVPLDFKPYPLAQAWADFHRIPFLTLGVESRADWVANGVLYAPLGFWAVRSLVAARLRPSAAGVVALLLGAALAVAVEFAQLFFPPRTVSQNDILAEVIGSGVGALAACLAGDWLAQLAGGWASGGGRLTRRLLELYAAGYTALCFFPYDLLLSAAELQDKLQSDAWGWLLAPHAAGSAKTALMLLVEAALAAPIGAWLVLRRRTSHAALALPPPLLAAALLGALFGVVVEGGQFFIATGISQGASVLTRAAGFAAGAWLAPQLQRTGTTALRQALRRPALLLALPYLALVFGASGVLSHGWRTVPEVVAAWADLHLLPFYYHYYTTEAIALVSLGSVALMFVPAAVLGWARGWPAAVTLAAVALLAAVVESLKLLLTGLHPDPTNVLIGAAAAATVLRLLGLLEAAVPPAATTAGSAAVAGFAASAGRGAAGATRAADAADAARDADADADAANAANAANAPPANAVAAAPAALSAWLLVLPVVAAQAFLFPVLPLGLTLLLAACAALVWRWPLLPLALLPALLPVLDLAPWSGRLFWDAYDMVSAVCLAVALHRTRGAGREPQPRWLPTAFALLAASLLASVVQALGPPSAWPALADDNAFTSLYSPFNALRVAKGAVWAWLFALLWRRLAGAGAGRNRWFSAGMLAGLAGSVAAVLWERTAFTTLADTAADFRVSGLFSTMNTGGAFIECWLAVATAFALAAALRVRSWPTRVAALVLLAGAAYALAVTYSRNGYAALAAVVIATLLSAVGSRRTAAGRGGRPGPVAAGTSLPIARRGAVLWRQAAWAAAAVATIAAVALPVTLGSFGLGRLATIGADLATRQAHWHDGLRMRDGGWRAGLVGMGIGRFPDTHYWRSQEALRAAPYGLRRADGAGSPRHLRLGSGARLYIDQIVARPPAAGPLRLAASVRAAPATQAAGTELAVALCEKWLLTSRRCVQARAAVGGGSDAAPVGWQPIALTLDAASLPARSAWWRPPLTLALLTPGNAAIDVADLHLTATDGSGLLHNGDFADGMDRWFFTTDVDPPWQLHSLPLHVLFDQGWLGVAAWSAVLVGALVAGTRLALRGQALVPAALPALCGFLVSGTLNTLIDAPRFLWLLLVLAWLAAQPYGQQGARAGAAARASAD